MTSNRMLIVASEPGLADSIRTHATRAGMACEVAGGVMESLLAIRTRAPAVVVVCDEPKRRALQTCDAVVPTARNASAFVLAVTMDDLEDHAVSVHRAGPNRAAQYVRVTEGAAEIVRIATLLARHAMPPSPPPPPPRATRRGDETLASTTAGHRIETRAGSTAVAFARPVAVAPAQTMAAPDRTESGVQNAVRPEALGQGAVDPKASGLAVESARRELAEARRVREALERRASEAEQRALAAEQRVTTSESREAASSEALKLALQAHEESETAWNERVGSAELLADQALKERDAVGRSLVETQRALESARGEIVQARTTIERERTRADRFARERDEAKVETENSRREARQLAARVETLEREIDRDRKVAAQLDRARERVAALDEELESVRGERDAAAARLEEHRREAEARAVSPAAEAGATATSVREDGARDEALEAARAEAAEIAANLERAKRVIRHLLEVHHKHRAAPKDSEGNAQAMLRLCNRIIETQERRIDVLESINDSSDLASQALVSESRRLAKELQILHAQLDRSPTSRH